jgi:ABC-type phosphate transport system auxiliary subunit
MLKGRMVPAILAVTKFRGHSWYIGVQVPLEKLLQRLQQHVDTIKADLIDVINADYPMFIQMAEKLRGVEGSAVQIQTPLLTLKESLSELQDRYRSELESLKECLERQSQV